MVLYLFPSHFKFWNLPSHSQLQCGEPERRWGMHISLHSNPNSSTRSRLWNNRYTVHECHVDLTLVVWKTGLSALVILYKCKITVHDALLEELFASRHAPLWDSNPWLIMHFEQMNLFKHKCRKNSTFSDETLWKKTSLGLFMILAIWIEMDSESENLLVKTMSHIWIHLFVTVHKFILQWC